LSFLQGVLKKSLDSVKLLPVLSLLVINLDAELHLGILRLLLDERELFLVEVVLRSDGIANDPFQLLELVGNTHGLFRVFWGHKEKVVAAFFEGILAPNFDVFLCKLGSEEVDVVGRLLGNFTICLRNDSDQEVHENDQQEDNVGEVEDHPDDTDHDFREEPIVIVFNLCFPEQVFRSGDISDGVSSGLHDVYKEISFDSMIIRFVEGGANKSIESSDEEDEDHEEGEETRNILDTGTKKRNHVTDGWVHSKEGENLQGGRSEDNDVDKKDWSVDMRADIIVRTDLNVPVWNDTHTGVHGSKGELNNVDQHVKHIVVVPEGLEIVCSVIEVLFVFDVNHYDNS
jgi:hypothetical protein